MLEKRDGRRYRYTALEAAKILDRSLSAVNQQRFIAQMKPWPDKDMQLVLGVDAEGRYLHTAAEVSRMIGRPALAVGQQRYAARVQSDLGGARTGKK